MPDDGGMFGPAKRLQPTNLRAEQALLGALLANNRAYDRVGAFLTADHFADEVHAIIFAAIARRIEAGQLADAVTLKAEFDGSGALDPAGGVGYLATLLSAMVGIVGAAEYGRAIYDAWLRREAIAIGQDLVEDGFAAAPDQDAKAVVTGAIESLLRLGEQAGSSVSGITTFGAALNGAVLRSEAAQRGDAGQSRLDTGVGQFDRLWCGLWPGQMYYLMARSRTGKTPAMLQIARNVAGRLLAEHSGGAAPLEHVHIFSLEMTAEDLATVNLASTTRWTADQIRSGDVDDWHALMVQRDALAALPIVIDDAPDMTLGQLVTRARLVHRVRRTRLVLIDYRELIGRGQEHARLGLPEWIPLLGYKLKALAKAIGVPVIALAQINKSRDDAEAGSRPTLRDLPYDGGQAADGVFAIHRPELTMGEEFSAPTSIGSAEKTAIAAAAWQAKRSAARGVAEFGALKRRFGPAGWASLRFDGPRMLFFDRSEQPAQTDLYEVES